MYSVKATLLALASSLVLTAGRPHLVSNSTKHQARASIPNVWAGDGVPQRHDIMLKSGPGDWIAAAICALGALSDDVIKTNVVNVRADGSAENGCVSVKLIDEDGKQQEQSACYFDTNSLQFNYGDYWWPNGIVQAMLGMGGYDGIRDGTLSAGTAADVFKMFGYHGVQATSLSSWRDDILWDILGADHTDHPVVIQTNGDTGILTPNHAYTVLPWSDQEDSKATLIFGLSDPCGTNDVHVKLSDVKHQLESMSYIIHEAQW